MTYNTARGVLCLTFDDRGFRDWLAAVPLFAKYKAHASFFISGNIDAEAIEVMKALAAAGHTVGLHTVHHRNAPEGVEADGFDAYFAAEIAPQLDACQAAGLNIRSFSYPNNRHTEETDSRLSQWFDHFRVGTRGETDAAYIPLADLPNRSVMCGIGLGSYYHTVEADVIAQLRRAADAGCAVTYFSHGIHEGAEGVDMTLSLLESILKEAQTLGLTALGFDEL